MNAGPNFSLSGRRALVTGASRGLGRAIALGLAHAGADVALAGRDEAALAVVAAEIAGIGGRAEVRRLDAADADGAADAVRAAAAALGGLDILVNNAGYEEVRPSLDVGAALWDRIVGVNLRGAFFVAQAAARIMAQDGGGAIVNQCSLTSYVGVPTAAPYGASKSGLLGLTRALATEWAPLGVRVNAVAPGYFRTAMTEPFYADEGWAQSMLARIPQRRFGQAEDVAGAVVFLCSDAAAYVTGQCLPVDGGYLASI
jgi:NAD(P)-dependent dehydrogenase (short-subunit alcohol dehydrogenase family)